MNNIVSKIILGFLFIVFFIILSFLTFFSNNKKEVTTPDFNIAKIWEQTLSGAILDKVSFYTSIYSKNKDYKIDDNNIIIWSWAYFIDSRDLFSDIIIKMWSNEILLKWGWMLYINNNPKYKTIVSFNNKAEINFINKNKNKWVKIFLYPHMQFSFRPDRFEWKKEADSLLVSKYGVLKYLNKNFSQLILEKENSFVKKDNLVFFKTCLEDIIKKQERYSEQLNNLKNKSFWNIKSSEYIEKYFTLFYNDRKKVIYYKNITLKFLINLLNWWDQKDINKILVNLKLIKNLDQKEYDVMREFVKEIFFLISYDLSDKSDLTQKNFDSLISKIFKINDSRKIKLIKDIDKYNYIWDFTKLLNLTVLDIENKDLTLLDKEYYILFKQKILLSNFANLAIEEKYYDILLKWFVSYTNNIEANIKIDEHDNFLWNVKLNVYLIEQISLSFEKRYFEDVRNSQDLLLLKENKWIKDIEIIQKSIENIFKKYLKAKTSFEERPNIDWKYIIKYDKLKKQLDEYIAALYNYSLYTKKYSKVNKIISNIKIYEDVEEELSKDKFIYEINKFYWINLSSIELEVKKNYYKVNNININGVNFSFDLFPYSWNLIKNIVYKKNGWYVDAREKWFYNQIESTSFSLDNEKEKYSDYYRKVDASKKEKYNFKNFFLNTFFISYVSDKENYNWIKLNSNNDDEIIQTFKNAKLLWNKWEFRNINTLLNIRYSNLDIKRKFWENFHIKIIDSELNLKKNSWKSNLEYWADFSSDYKLEINKHYFYNIKLRPYIKRTSSKNDIFPWVTFAIRWKINLLEFKIKIKEIFNEIPKIEKEFIKLSKKQEINSITYNIITKKYYFR